MTSELKLCEWCGAATPCSDGACPLKRNTRAAPDVPELVRYRLNSLGELVYSENGQYVLHSQAAEIIASNDAEINRLSQSSNQADQSLVDKYRDPQSGLFNFPTDVAKIVRRLEAAEAKLAQYEAQEPVAWWVPDGFGELGASLRDKIHLGSVKPALWIGAIPLYAAPVPEKD